jgi:Transposase IS4
MSNYINFFNIVIAGDRTTCDRTFGILKIFWACDSGNSFPLKGEVYVGQQPGAGANNNKVIDLVKRLVRPWMNTGRNITMDNYFTSIELANDLLAVRTTIVGTVRKNRRDIPAEMQASRKRVEKSSIFGFDNQLTLTSYVPKKGKAVIMLSSMHHDDTIDAGNNSKPEIIAYYNSKKSGVDNLDHLIGLYTCRRKTRRWPLTLFFNIVDTAGVASYVIWCAMHPDYQVGKTHKRRLYLV